MLAVAPMNRWPHRRRWLTILYHTPRINFRDQMLLHICLQLLVSGHMPRKLPKSTSDDSHLADDSKQESQLKDWQVVMEGTSDDTHLAHESKRPENAAGSSEDTRHMAANLPKSTSDDTHLAAGYAPQVQEERRVAADGHSYTHQEFLEHYDEEWKATIEWNAAKNTHPPPPPLPPPPTPPPPAAAVNTLLTPRTAEQIRTSTRIAGTCKKKMRAFLDATSFTVAIPSYCPKECIVTRSELREGHYFLAVCTYDCLNSVMQVLLKVAAVVS